MPASQERGWLSRPTADIPRVSVATWHDSLVVHDRALPVSQRCGV